MRWCSTPYSTTETKTRGYFFIFPHVFFLAPPPAGSSGRVQDGDDRNDRKELQNVLYEVVSSYLRIVLSQKALQKNVITLSSSEVEEWKSIVQNGDWVGLITHPSRMYVPCSFPKTMYCNLTLKLQKPAEDLAVDRQAEDMQASFFFVSHFILTRHTLLVSTMIKVRLLS